MKLAYKWMLSFKLDINLVHAKVILSQIHQKLSLEFAYSVIFIPIKYGIFHPFPLNLTA